MIQTGKDVLTMIRIGVVNIDISHPKTFSEAYKTDHGDQVRLR